MVLNEFAIKGLHLEYAPGPDLYPLDVLVTDAGEVCQLRLWMTHTDAIRLGLQVSAAKLDRAQATLGGDRQGHGGRQPEPSRHLDPVAVAARLAGRG